VLSSYNRHHLEYSCPLYELWMDCSVIHRLEQFVGYGLPDPRSTLVLLAERPASLDERRGGLRQRISSLAAVNRRHRFLGYAHCTVTTSNSSAKQC
jgi:hypothetical protein